MEMHKVMCFPCSVGHSVTILEWLQQFSRKLPWKSLTEVCLFHSVVNDVGGVVAQWFVLLPPRSLHVSPKFSRWARQVDRRLGMCVTKSIMITTVVFSIKTELLLFYHSKRRQDELCRSHIGDIYMQHSSQNPLIYYSIRMESGMKRTPEQEQWGSNNNVGYNPRNNKQWYKYYKVSHVTINVDISTTVIKYLYVYYLHWTSV